MVFIYTTCENEQEAERLAKLILDNRLGACVDYWAISSMYHWEGELKKLSQFMILITTLESKLENVNELISKNHNYSVPLIAGVDIRRMNKAYKAWMGDQIE